MISQATHRSRSGGGCDAAPYGRTRGSDRCDLRSHRRRVGGLLVPLALRRHDEAAREPLDRAVLVGHARPRRGAARRASRARSASWIASPIRLSLMMCSSPRSPPPPRPSRAAMKAAAARRRRVLIVLLALTAVSAASAPFGLAARCSRGRPGRAHRRLPCWSPAGRSAGGRQLLAAASPTPARAGERHPPRRSCARIDASDGDSRVSTPEGDDDTVGISRDDLAAAASATRVDASRSRPPTAARSGTRCRSPCRRTSTSRSPSAPSAPSTSASPAPGRPATPQPTPRRSPQPKAAETERSRPPRRRASQRLTPSNDLRRDC